MIKTECPANLKRTYTVCRIPSLARKSAAGRPLFLPRQDHRARIAEAARLYAIETGSRRKIARRIRYATGSRRRGLSARERSIDERALRMR